jgi:hypothetical protein
MHTVTRLVLRTMPAACWLTPQSLRHSYTLLLVPCTARAKEGSVLRAAASNWYAKSASIHGRPLHLCCSCQCCVVWPHDAHYAMAMGFPAKDSPAQGFPARALAYMLQLCCVPAVQQPVVKSSSLALQTLPLSSVISQLQVAHSNTPV